MRIFPSASRRRAVAASAVVTLALGALAVHSPLTSYADEGDHLKHQHRHVRGQIKQVGADLEESSRAFRTASQALTSAQAQLVDARSQLADVTGRLRDARAHDQQVAARLAAAQAALVQAGLDVDAGQTAVADQRQAVVDTVTSLYEQGDPQLLTFSSLLQSHSVEDLTRRTEVSRIAVERQDDAYDGLRASEVLLGVRAEQVTDAKDAVAVEKAASAAHVAQVADLRAKAAAAASRVEGLVERGRIAKRSADAARDLDTAVLARLRQQDAKIKAQIVAAAKAAAAAAAAKGDNGYVGPSDGYLLAPVTGPVTSPFGYRIHPIYGYWGLHDGTDFGVACGEDMRAAADGTVTSAYYSDVYGNRLYLDVGRIDGHAITVVYNHASGYRVGVGDHVERGETVGYVGSTGWSTGCHLHFTVLQDGTAVDPMGYL